MYARPKREIKQTHPISNDGLQSVGNLLGQAPVLEDVDDPDEDQKSLALDVSGRDATHHVGVVRVIGHAPLVRSFPLQISLGLV